MSVIIHCNDGRKEYFFSTDHCQGVKEGDIKLDKAWVPTTFHLPQRVVPRPAFPTGWISSVADVIKLHFSDYTEIQNPDTRYKVR